MLCANIGTVIWENVPFMCWLAVMKSGTASANQGARQKDPNIVAESLTKKAETAAL